MTGTLAGFFTLGTSALDLLISLEGCAFASTLLSKLTDHIQITSSGGIGELRIIACCYWSLRAEIDDATMSQSLSSRRPDGRSQKRHSSALENEQSGPSVDTNEVLSLLSDNFAREVLEAVYAEPLAAREIATRLDVSRATVYRRLNGLKSAGLVEQSIEYHEAGHHRKQFQAVIDRIQLTLTADRLDVECA
jgi:predicted transcriptional regulator